MELFYDPEILFWAYTQTIVSRNSNRYLPIYVYSSIIHNSQKMETIHLSIDGWMDKQNMIYSYNKIFFSLKSENKF